MKDFQEKLKKRLIAISTESISLSDSTAILFFRRLLSAFIIWSVITLFLLPFTVTIASPGYNRETLPVSGTTTTRFRYLLAISLLTITAGLVFCISVPTAGSNSTHQILPRVIWRRQVQNTHYTIRGLLVHVQYQQPLPYMHQFHQKFHFALSGVNNQENHTLRHNILREDSQFPLSKTCFLSWLAPSIQDKFSMKRRNFHAMKNEEFTRGCE